MILVWFSFVSFQMASAENILFATKFQAGFNGNVVTSFAWVSLFRNAVGFKLSPGRQTFGLYNLIEKTRSLIAAENEVEDFSSLWVG